MDNLHTETIMSQFPMLAVNAMENGGQAFDEEGNLLDAADLPHDPLKVWIDFENGDGAKGVIPLSAEDFSDDEEADPEEDDGGQTSYEPRSHSDLAVAQELRQLIDEQDRDRSSEILPEIIPSHAATAILPIRFTGASCDERLSRSYGQRGRNDRYKNKRRH